MLFNQINKGIYIFRLGENRPGGIFIAAAFASVDVGVLFDQLVAVVLIGEEQHGIGRFVD